ncbi:UDP-N-acetylmuramoyl-L-alanine--D-glutamate ligase [Solemya velum gill symbiont]|uniref:UDP-N-acetylmuramoyl-L-alanine--D-glutamate ligase n=1 Tax=Solemya velum gill symbiont TaxID=2340 RepID=UPI000997B72D|nr:UDP-N-acetylmuramoyl-L-alanine--D-glutamate ligase [Solemya velum gill symbiont]OOY52989.1 UDP-N-acetylmuramoylalanine--D-glutamate ligase [Solemya velum gill symbiont]OOY63222.1 UDP-N-acetylmuramoylalanine--D-glutamate ligase [Solemya velum gill symbiont]OOY64617.1 UDP-N-acetylmuramoylalanine--D-glutamate ligase [Solemya velum gill symbiont]OOY68076.1 UDP-N-acetylmuramoylalanine--D-glutamate ligase [Solemya velum gill symbiont]OOY72246.1 UDP-N-acetylmuramoylalanine--D-glutamate ligase [Sol
MAITEDKMEAPRTLVVGLGVTGLSCVRFLCAQGVSVEACDSRGIPPGLAQLQSDYPEVVVVTGAFNPEQFARAERLVVSPGVPLAEAAIQDAIEAGVEVIGDIELFIREAAAPIIAITGSNGKSTVTTLLGEMAKAAGKAVAVGGNLGIPVLDLLDETAELYVLELSSFQLELVHSLRAEAAVVLNLSADHMDRYDSYADYVAAKAVVYANAKHAVVNRDDADAAALAETEKSVGFTTAEPSDGDFGLRSINGESWLCHGDEALLPVSGLRIVGQHNVANVLAALALGHASGLPMQAMLDAAVEFHGLPHRTQFVAEKNGVSWYNDSKGTNVGAVVSALQGLDHNDTSRTVLIAGGDCKGASFNELAEVAPTYIRTLVLIGRDAQQIADALPAQVHIQYAGDMAEAVAAASAAALPGDRVLLSPACASFDMYKNYIERGEVFMAEVGRLL